MLEMRQLLQLEVSLQLAEGEEGTFLEVAGQQFDNSVNHLGEDKAAYLKQAGEGQRSTEISQHQGGALDTSLFDLRNVLLDSVKQEDQRLAGLIEGAMKHLQQKGMRRRSASTTSNIPPTAQYISTKVMEFWGRLVMA